MRVASKLWWPSLIVVSVKRSCFWFNIQLETATGSLLTAKTIYVSRKDDFAILKVQGENFPMALPICYATYPTAGEEVIAIGSPRGLTNTITRGIPICSPENN